MRRKTTAIVALAVVCAVIVTTIIGNVVQRHRTINLIGESVVYNMYFSAREIDRCFSDKSADLSYQITSAALYLQKAHSQLDSAMSSSFDIDSRKSFAGDMEEVAQFMLLGGSVGESFIRPAAQIHDVMTDDEIAFYLKLSEIMKTISHERLFFDEDNYITGFRTMNQAEINRIALEFQERCAVQIGQRD